MMLHVGTNVRLAHIVRLVLVHVNCWQCSGRPTQLWDASSVVARGIHG